MPLDLIQQLKQQSRNADFGASSVVEKESAKATLMQAIGHQEKEVVTFGSQLAGLVRWMNSAFVSLPTAGVTVAVVILLGGSITTVGAYNSLPGDTLYSVKIASENAQIKLVSKERRVLLRTEFAGRRLEEAAAIARGGKEDSAERSNQALEAYRAQIDLVESDLESLKESEPEKATLIAVEVGEQIDSLNALIDSEGNSSEEVMESTDDAAKAVVAVIVDAKEKEDASDFKGEVINREIEETYQKRLRELNERHTFAIGRVTRLKEWYRENGLRPDESVLTIEEILDGVSDQVFDSMSYIAQGGYRKSFELLDTSNDELRDIESSLVSLELQIIEDQQTKVDERVEAILKEEQEQQDVLEEESESDIIPSESEE